MKKAPPPPRGPVGTEPTARLRPRLRYELVGCALHGHELLGTDAARLREADALVAREDAEGLRWYRCLRCDSWLPLAPPAHPAREHLPPRDEVDLPLRGRPLRDRWVLRLIAVDRGVHCAVLAALAAAVFLFLHDRSVLDSYWVRIARDLQASVGGSTPGAAGAGGGLVAAVDALFTTSPVHLVATGAVLAAYAALEGTEAVALWRGRRWAEYLALVATAVLLVPEAYELAEGPSALRAGVLVLNAAVVAYLLVAKRLFGVRGGARAERRERALDTGWAALERTLPAVRPAVQPAAAAPSRR